MSPKRRRLMVFLLIDAVVVAILAVWLAGRHQPAAARPPPAAPTASPVPAVPDGSLPSAPTGAVECHGTFAGAPFWLRLSAPDPELGGNRKLQLVYTPPAQAEVEGAAIHDSAVLLLDAHLRVVKWDNRDGATGVLLGDPAYTVVREIHTPGVDQIALKTRKLTCAAAWDLRLAPLLAALAWKPGQRWTAPVVDFWGPRASERLTATCSERGLDLAGVPCTVQASPDGRVAALLDARSQPLLSIAGWTP